MPITKPKIVKKPKKSGIKKISPKKKVATSPKPNLINSLRQRLELKQTDFSKLLGVSIRSLASLEGGKEPSEGVSRKIRELQRLIKSLSEVIKEETIGTWLTTPNQAFGNLKPLEVIDRGEVDQIWSMIYFLRSGDPF